MDLITKASLAEFAKAHKVEDLAEDKQFEHFAAFITLRRHHTRTFDTAEIVVGAGGDTSIDSIAILVNGALVSDIDSVNELKERNNYIEASFIFVQAERSSSFDSAKIGNTGFGVEDFFKDKPTLVRNERIQETAAIAKAIFAHGNLFRSKPACRIYYVTTGTWADDQNLVARINGCKAALQATKLFGQIEFICYGADQIHKLYNQTKNAVTRAFTFKDRTEIPAIEGVGQAYLGFVPAKEFVEIIKDDSGDDILGSIFDENVRDWQDYNVVNKEISSTLGSDRRGRFVLMNNGVTLIAKNVRAVGSRFTIEDFQIVNGCQTSHVVFDKRNSDLSNVSIPLRLIETQDDDVKEAVVRATNRQTELKPEQLYALTDFAKKLESYFGAVPEERRLFYERRDCQYDRFPEVEKTRIVMPQGLIRAFAAMFLDEPTRVTRQYKAIRDLVGQSIFKEGHRLEPYYVAAYAAYRLDFLFRNHKMDGAYKAARYHILMALRYLINASGLPEMSSNEMEKRCKEMIGFLCDTSKSDAAFTKAAEIVREVVGKPFDRDHIRTEPTKDALLGKFGAKGKA
ncbi:MAG: AIPR family protein [Rhodospirillales bacterium]|nr:AIPR family protein [Rhodospirillales bacterium]